MLKNVSSFAFRFSLFICLSISAEAQIRTQRAGDWKDCAVWPSTQVSTPKPTDHVQLDHVIRLTKDQNVGEISLGSGGALNLNGFGIGFGGVDTSVPCCINMRNVHANSPQISMDILTWSVVRSSGNKSNVSDGSYATTYEMEPGVRNSGKWWALLDVEAIIGRFPNKYKNYKFTVKGSIESRVYTQRNLRGDCDLHANAAASGRGYRILKTAKNTDYWNLKTETFSFTLDENYLYATGDRSAQLVLRVSRDRTYSMLTTCRLVIEEIRFSADCD